MPTPTITIARTADLAPCLELENRCFPPAEAASRENIARRIELFPQGFLVARLNGRIVGHVNSGCTAKDDISDEALKALIGHDPAGGNLVVFSLAVDPEFRCRGLGGKLMREFARAGQKMNKKKVLLICKQDLMAFYSRLGYRHLGPSASTHGGAAWHEMALAL